ncbi:MAG TPA: ribonuclease Z [Xanthobacteraceae bacterium]|nr:ribonuclease Z [Xanthobacteraceae bacterium]
MSLLLQPRLTNEPFSDPGVFVDVRFGRRALMFDLGDNFPLSPRELFRVSHALVSHAHMDHFSGFDRLLRVCLHRDRPLHLVGPPGFADRVAAKIAAYSWNLLDAGSVDFALVVDEFDGRLTRRARFAARAGLARRDAAVLALAPGLVVDEDDFSIEAVVFDHGLPCLGFALQERLRVNVWREGLAALKLPVGPWLNEAKRAVRRGDSDDTAVAVGDGRTMPLGELRTRALQAGPGQRIVYITDIAGHADNIARAVKLAAAADTLFIEAPFADADAAIAAERRHLTAALAGRIAREAGVRQVIPFHFSARYAERPELIPAEVDAAFRGVAVK